MAGRGGRMAQSGVCLAVAAAAFGAVVGLSANPWPAALGLLVCVIASVWWDRLWDALWATLSPRPAPGDPGRQGKGPVPPP